MSLRTTIATVVTILALAPATAQASSGYRTVIGAGSGEATVNTATLRLTADVDVWLSSIGRANVQWEAQGSRADGIVRAVGAFTIATPHGDTLTGTGSMVGVGPTFTPHPAGLILTILGGTGRFAGASGTIVSAPMLTPRPFSPPVLAEKVESAIHGFIDY